MRLTDRQCWDIIRALVKVKNDEYSALLLSWFDNSQMRQVLGYTRDTFLSKMGISSLGQFNSDIKRFGHRQPASQWLDNLSSEDLVLFLDFRCRFLQKIYDYYNQYGNISVNEIKSIVNETNISKLKGHNYSSLICTGKPERGVGEKKVSELTIEPTRLKNAALNQTLNNMVDNYIDIQNKPIEEVVEIAKKIKTYNIDLNGNITGFEFDCNIDMAEEIEFKPKQVGFDIQGTPVLEYEDGYYTSTGRRLDDDEQIYAQGDDFTL